MIQSHRKYTNNNNKSQQPQQTKRTDQDAIDYVVETMVREINCFKDIYSRELLPVNTIEIILEIYNNTVFRESIMETSVNRLIMELKTSKFFSSPDNFQKYIQEELNPISKFKNTISLIELITTKSQDSIKLIKIDLFEKMFKLYCFEESEKDDQFIQLNQQSISSIKKILLIFKQKQTIYKDDNTTNTTTNNVNTISNDEITYKNRTIIPTVKEIRSLVIPKLKPIKFGEYSSVDEYLDTHFNLLREDFIHPIRETLGQLENGSGKSTSYLYTDVTFKGFQKSKYSISLVIQFNYKRVINWERFSKLLNGSLLVLSNDGFKDEIYFATVETRPLKGSESTISISFYNDTDYGKLEYFFQNKFTMIESPTYFESIRNVLQSIQSIQPDELPLKKYLLQCSKDTIPPKYIRDNPIINLSKTFIGSLNQFDIISSLYVDADDIGDVNKFPTTLGTLDSSQIDAFEHALTSQLSLIQGPPGTGKSKIGMLLFDVIYKHLSSIQLKLESRDSRLSGNRYNQAAVTANHHSPILILCYTNHALDQFLNGILESTENVIRIGSRSKDLNIKKYNLFDKVKQLEEDNAKRFARFERENLLITIKSKLDNISNILSFNEFKEFSSGCGGIGYQNIEYDFFDEYQAEENKDNQQANNVNISKIDWDDWINSIIKLIKQDIIDTKFNSQQPLPPKNGKGNQLEEDDDDEIVEELLNNRRFDFDQTHEKLESIDIGYLYQLLKLPDHSFQDIQEEDGINDIFDLYDNERILYYRFLLKKKINLKMEEIQQLIQQFKLVSSRFKDYENQATRQVLLKSDVIAATITGASRMKKVFDKLSIKVVIIEEAAEVHEGHIVSVLPSTTEHLLLIGDHLQLKPSCSVYQLGKRYNLDVSLFERLLKNGSAHKQLKIQRRMVPNISQFIKPIYPDLQNHSSVIDREHSKINGMPSNLYFISHEHLESTSIDNNTSKSNLFEAEFVVGLADYLIKQNHLPSDIVILTPYTGQLQLIKQLIQTNFKSTIGDPNAKQLTKVNVRTIDMFQGEERNIVLLSLVRSNENEDTGFVKIENRINVAISRAKFAMYMFGNRKLLEKSNRIWKNMFQILDPTFLNNQNSKDKDEQQIDKEQEHHQPQLLPLISNSVVLTCGNHFDQISKITCGNDFKSLVPEGGCLKNCISRLSCGHKCEKLCHLFNPSHSNVFCTKPCSKVNESCNHKCLKRCSEECYPCIEKVEKTISPCNHKLILNCDTIMNDFVCPIQCNKLLKCSHLCKLKCGQHCDREPCNEIIEKQSPCGHLIKKECSKSNDNDKCDFICKELLECGDQCLSKCEDHTSKINSNGEKQIVHPDCSKKECKRVLVCNHICTGNHGCLSGKCGTCQHKCENQCKHSRCKEQCGKECIGCIEICNRGCLHVGKCKKLCREQCEIVNCNEPCPKKIKPCGHKCVGLCGEKCPSICRECTPDYYEPISMMKLSEFEESDRFITLHGDHTFLVDNLDSLMNLKQDDGKIILKKCPNLICQLVIKSKECSRYKDLINQDWDDFNKIKKLNSPLTKNDRDSIVKSFGSAAGHWFKCKNGHYFYIGECGGAMEVARCIECDEQVGGTNHKLLPSNQLAGEIDGAKKPLYQPLFGNF